MLRMTAQPVVLTLVANIPPERLATVTRNLSSDLSSLGIKPLPSEQSPEQGIRGDAITLGQIALGLITSGSVTALIECLKAYIAREHSLIIKVTRPDGTTVEVNEHNISQSTTEQAVKNFATIR
jgi:hypothetical protein